MEMNADAAKFTTVLQRVYAGEISFEDARGILLD